jgi:CheY-like chemotaxis protein
MEMPANYRDSAAVDAGALIASITGAPQRPVGPTPLAASDPPQDISPGALGAGFFICPDAAAGLAAAPRACIASHDAAQSRLLALLVKRAGAIPDPVATREALLASLRASPHPDVLFLDTDLPGIDGFHALESIRAKPPLQTLRIVLVAATGRRADLARALQLGATGYIAKPLTRDIMEAALPQIFGKRKAS